MKFNTNFLLHAILCGFLSTPTQGRIKSIYVINLSNKNKYFLSLSKHSIALSYITHKVISNLQNIKTKTKTNTFSMQQSLQHTKIPKF